jgi:type IV secretion system protein VirB5
MNLKQAVACAIFATSLSIATGAQAQLATLVVGDAPAIMNQIETMMQWAEEFEKWKKQAEQMGSVIQQGKQTYIAITGSRGMGSVLNSPQLRSSLPADWDKVMDSIKSTGDFRVERAKYPIDASRPKLMKMYDQLAANGAAFSIEFRKANGRLQNVQSLMAQIEQNAIAATLQQTQVLKARQESEMLIAQQEAQHEFTCREFKKC